MYERFTDEARDAIMEAQVEARALAHDYIGAEHLLLGVLRLPVRRGIGPTVLADLGITLARARAEVRRRVSGPEPGLTDEDVKALRSIGIDVDEVRRRVEEAFGPGALDAPVGGNRGPVFNGDAKHALEVAVRESIKLGHQHVGAEHLLLAIAGEDGLTVDILQSLDAEPTVIRTRVLDQLGRAA